jgi:hypothetical protein
MTRSLRSWAARAASTYSAPKRIAMLDHHGLDLRVGQQFYELGAASIPAGTDLGYGLNNGQAMMMIVSVKPRGGLIVLPNPFFGPTRKLGRIVRRHERES